MFFITFVFHAFFGVSYGLLIFSKGKKAAKFQYMLLFSLFYLALFFLFWVLIEKVDGWLKISLTPHFLLLSLIMFCYLMIYNLLIRAIKSKIGRAAVIGIYGMAAYFVFIGWAVILILID